MEDSTRRRSMTIVVGPTPGHVYPALAIGEAYRRAVGELDLLVVDTPGGLAANLLPDRGWRRATVSGSPIASVGPGGLPRALASTLVAFGQARRFLRAYRVRLVIGLGAYASGGVVLAARSLGLTAVIHEANAVPGIANRLLAPIVDRVYAGFASAARSLPARRTVVTGHPIRAEIAALVKVARTPPGRERPARVLVLAGARGAGWFADHIPALLERVARSGQRLDVSHQAGDAEPAAIERAYARAGIAATVVARLGAVADAYRWADVAVVRGGAGTLTEVAVAGVPALVVPLADAAREHQAANARAFVGSGAGLAGDETDWQPEPLASRLARLLADPQAWAAASAGARRFASPDGAERVVAECEALMRGRW
jgi:UDP-N-acetylglucosamine--N-acetylmuramyl-(pentapeptide) pyrophosphoryl-undecaprenol N-acetylglucosamine transferase